ncbi:hypothetical protein F5X99DRAFT_409319 [Biscogniauxia marginata]|nr:hypothetical protein F5X99DRAFT_409319 [Biscogniauxia marginata]
MFFAKMFDFLLKHLTVLVLALAAIVSFYGGCFGAAVEQDSSSFSPAFYYCVSMAIIITLYLSKVHGVLGVLSALFAMLLYKLVYDVDFRLVFVALVCQTLLFIKTDYGWHGFWGALHVYQVYKVGLSCLPWLWFGLIGFLYTKCMAEVLPPTLRGDMNYFDRSRPREPTPVRQSELDRLVLSWVSLLKDLDYAAPLAKFLRVNCTILACAVHPVLYMVEDFYNSIRGAWKKLGIALHEIIYEGFDCCEPESIRLRREADVRVAATMKEMETLAEQNRKNKELQRRQEQQAIEADLRAEEEQRKAREAERKARAEELSKRWELERLQKKRQARQDREIPYTRLPYHPVPPTVDWWMIQREEEESRRQRAKYDAWIAEQRRILSPDDFSEMMIGRMRNANEAARKIEEELYANPLRVTHPDPSACVNRGHRSIFQCCTPDSVPAGETVVPGVKPPRSGPFFAPETPRLSLADRCVLLTPDQLQPPQPSNLLLGATQATPYAEQQQYQLEQQQLQLAQQLQLQFQQQQQLQFPPEQWQLQPQPEPEPEPEPEPLPAPTVPSSESMFGPAPSGPSIFASSKSSKPSTPVNKLLAAAAEGRYAPTEESQPGQQEEHGLVWDPMDIDEPEPSEELHPPLPVQHHSVEQPSQEWLDEQDEALQEHMRDYLDEEPTHQDPVHASAQQYANEQPVLKYIPEPVKYAEDQEPVQQPAVQAPAQQLIFQGFGGQVPVQQPAVQEPAQQYVFQQPVQQPVVPEPVKQPAAQGPVRRPVTPVNLIINYPGAEQPVRQSVEQPQTEWPAETDDERSTRLLDELRFPKKRSKNPQRSESPEIDPETEKEPVSPSKRTGKSKSSSSRPKSYQSQIRDMVARGYDETTARAMAGRSFR